MSWTRASVASTRTRAGPRRVQRRIERGHRLVRRVGRHGVERRGLGHLHAEVVVRRLARSARGHAREARRRARPAGRCTCAARCWARRPCVTSAPERSWCCEDGREVQRRQRVAVDDQESRTRRGWARRAAAAGRPEHRRLPRVADAHAEVLAVADDARERLRHVMQVEHDVGDAGRRAASARMRPTSGWPATGSAALARTSDSGRSRVARPAVRTSAGNHAPAASPASNSMSRARQVVRLRERHEEPAIRVEDEVGGRAAQRVGHRQDAFFRAFDFEVGADRRLVERDDDARRLELLAELLIAEPRLQAELLQHAAQDLGVGHLGFLLLAHLHRARLHRSLEGDEGAIGLAAQAHDGAPRAQRAVGGVVERVVLEAAGPQRHGPDCWRARPERGQDRGTGS